MTGTTSTATVETLTAEVRVLQVGSRQVTLSVARQLDRIDADKITPMGRVKTGRWDGSDGWAHIEVIGADESGALSLAVLTRRDHWCSDSTSDHRRCPEHEGQHNRHKELAAAFAEAWTCPHPSCGHPHGSPHGHGSTFPVVGEPDRPRWTLHKFYEYEPDHETWTAWSALPLIVLAGLR